MEIVCVLYINIAIKTNAIAFELGIDCCALFNVFKYVLSHTVHAVAVHLLFKSSNSVHSVHIV